MFSHWSLRVFTVLLAGHRFDPSSHPCEGEVLLSALIKPAVCQASLPLFKEKQSQDKAAENTFSEFFLPWTAPSERQDVVPSSG